MQSRRLEMLIRCCCSQCGRILCSFLAFPMRFLLKKPLPWTDWPTDGLTDPLADSDLAPVGSVGCIHHLPWQQPGQWVLLYYYCSRSMSVWPRKQGHWMKTSWRLSLIGTSWRLSLIGKTHKNGDHKKWWKPAEENVKWGRVALIYSGGLGVLFGGLVG